MIGAFVAFDTARNAGWVLDGNGCWIWAGRRKRSGYGVVVYGGTHGRGRREVFAHRAVYEKTKGPIPDGLELDHLCRTKACVNPDHLEPVTGLVNTQRFNASRTHCVHGHPFDEANTYYCDGRRQCRACGRDRRRRYLNKKRSP